MPQAHAGVLSSATDNEGMRDEEKQESESRSQNERAETALSDFLFF
jgi:hypothetical protein